MTRGKSRGANLGFEQKLFQAADKLRSNMDAAEYKHVVLGLIFLKYISDAFNEIYEELRNDPEGLSDPEDIDEYKMRNVFWVPSEARWNYLQKNAKQPEIGVIIDNAMDAIERENPSLKGVLPREYARPTLSKQRLGELIDLIGTIGLIDKESGSKDILGRVYEYFLGQFADAEGKKGGQFYTPGCIVKLLVEMIEPFRGRIYDPCCGSGGMFVQSEKFIEAHGGKIGDISIYGQESNPTTWRLCKMNLSIRRIDANIQWGDSFHNDLHRDLRADFILANPPFNDSDWGGKRLRLDVRWKFGAPPIGNANFAWVQHFIHHLAPSGIAGFVLANGSMSSDTGGEGTIRKDIIEAEIVDCMVALPSQLFYNTMIPACLWFIARDKTNSKFRKRDKEVLFIDARKMGVMVDRRHKELPDGDIDKIAATYHAWRNKDGGYEDIPGFCKSATLEEIRENNYILTPGRYVGIEKEKDDGEPFDEKMERLTVELAVQFNRSNELEEEIRKYLGRLGYVLQKRRKTENLRTTKLDYSDKQTEETVSISDMAEVVLGGTPRTDIPEYWNGDIKWASAKDIANNESRYLYDTERKITQDGVDSSPARVLPRDTIIITARGTVGQLALLSEPMAFNQTCYGLVVRESVLPLFLYYKLKTLLVHMDSISYGTVFNTITMRTFDEIKTTFPLVGKQENIVNILNSLDSKIELNVQMNKTLETIGQALFRHWFINFEFPNENGRPYKSSGGEMVFSDELDRETPEGWKIMPIDEIADFLNGLAMQKYPTDNEKDYFPVIKIKELKKGVTESTDKANLDIPPQYIIEDGDIVFSWSGSLELVVWVGGKGALNQHLFKVTSDLYPKWFYYYWIKHYLGNFRHIAAGKATTMGHIRRHHLSEALVTIPSQLIMDRLNTIMNPILNRIIQNKKESLILSRILNELLPRLMAGEIRVSTKEVKYE